MSSLYVALVIALTVELMLSFSMVMIAISSRYRSERVLSLSVLTFVILFAMIPTITAIQLLKAGGWV